MTNDRLVPLIDTIQYKGFRDFLEQVNGQTGIGLVMGNSRVGKTESARGLTNNDPRTIFCQLTPVNRNVGGLYRAMLASLLEKSLPSRLSQLRTILKEELFNRGIQVIVIDEADFLGKQSLDELHTLINEINIAVILIHTTPSLDSWKNGSHSAALLRWTYTFKDSSRE